MPRAAAKDIAGAVRPDRPGALSALQPRDAEPVGEVLMAQCDNLSGNHPLKPAEHTCHASGGTAVGRAPPCWSGDAGTTARAGIAESGPGRVLAAGPLEAW